MSVASFASLIAKLNNSSQYGRFCKVAQIGSGTGWNSEWTSSGFPAAGAVPGTTAATCDRTTVGALGQGNKAGTEQRVAIRKFGEGSSTVVGGTILLVDRLAQVGGLFGNVTTAQTVAFPALTRFTSGVDVWAGVEIYTAIGATGTTFTTSYTNTVPTAGRTSVAMTIGGAGFQNSRRVIPVPLAVGDLGITAMASITVLATTGAAGNFGVTLFKTLGAWTYNASWPFATPINTIPNGMPMPVIPDNACLQLLHFGGGQVATTLTAEFGFFED